MTRTCLVTTTNSRPLCFSILEKWVREQTATYDEWLVVNDSDHPEEYTYTMGQTVIERTDTGLRTATRNLPSICKNWLEAIKHLDGFDIVHVMEDDDFYSPQYLETMNSLLENTQLAGISHDVYFKLPTRKYTRMHNQDHASLACTSFRTDILPHVKRIAKVFDSVFLDMYIWAEAGAIWPCTRILKPQPLPDGKMLHVGMKNMPGAKGLGIGHANPYSGTSDPVFAQLAQWIGGTAAKVYARLWQDEFGPKKEERKWIAR